jgi:hypothetical protein
VIAESASRRACRYLLASGPCTAGEVGGHVWQGFRRGRISSAWGGGDYAAQMLLGRLAKKGLVRRKPSEGATLWELTEEGRELFR